MLLLGTSKWTADKLRLLLTDLDLDADSNEVGVVWDPVPIKKSVR